MRTLIVAMTAAVTMTGAGAGTQAVACVGDTCGISLTYVHFGSLPGDVDMAEVYALQNDVLSEALDDCQSTDCDDECLTMADWLPCGSNCGGMLTPESMYPRDCQAYNTEYWWNDQHEEWNVIGDAQGSCYCGCGGDEPFGMARLPLDDDDPISVVRKSRRARHPESAPDAFLGLHALSLTLELPSVEIAGHVARPGRYSFVRSANTLVRLIEAAGGLLPGADVSSVEIIRTNPSGKIERVQARYRGQIVDPPPQSISASRLRPGDLVIVR